MGRPAAKELTARELEIMQVFWRDGELTVNDVRDALAHEGLDRAYTTIATLVRILHEKGFLDQTTEERAFRFRPTRSHDEVAGRLLDDLIDKVFQGSREALLVRLMDQKKLTAKERAALEAIIKEQRR